MCIRDRTKSTRQRREGAPATPCPGSARPGPRSATAQCWAGVAGAEAGRWEIPQRQTAKTSPLL
eukprot:6839147-Lingulodinium_polyedra.AAC.1